MILFRLWIFALIQLLASTGANAQTVDQHATVSGVCGIAVNASGHAIVKVSGTCDSKLAATMQKLLDLGRDTNKRVAELQQGQQRRFDELLAAVLVTRDRARQPDATPLEKQAAAAIDEGDPTLAIELFGQAAKIEMERAANLVEQVQKSKKKAASYYRNQAALLRTRDSLLALAALEKALALVPDEFIALWEAGALAALTGRTDKAMAIFRRMVVRAEAEVKAAPTSVEWQRNLAVSYNLIGNMQRVNGDIAGALVSYRAALVIQQAIAAALGKVQAQRDLWVTQNKIGDMLSDQGDNVGALRSYQASLVIAQKLVASDPASVLAQRDLSVSYNMIGFTQNELRDNAGALRSCQAAMAIRQKLAAADPDNAREQRDLLVSHIFIGDLLNAQGDRGNALGSYGAALGIAQKLAATNPGSAQAKHDLLTSHSKVGKIQSAQGERAGALLSFKTAMAIAQGLAVVDPNNVDWQTDLIEAMVDVSQHDTQRSEIDRAKVVADAQATLHKLQATGRLTVDGVKLLSAIQQLLAAPSD